MKEAGVARFGRLPAPVQWLAILIASVLFAWLLGLVSLPATLLIGPMIAGILAGVNGATVRPPRLFLSAAQAMVGCLVARSIELDMIRSFLAEWPLFMSVVLATLAASSALGYLVARWNVLPGTTAVWGSTPGGASAMVFMAEAFGADARLVAFMQYLRVITVSVTAAVIAGLWIGGTPESAGPVDWFPAIDWASFGLTIAVAAVGAPVARLVRLPAATFLGPMALGVLVHLWSNATLQLPPWLLGASYAVVGWWIGLGFTRPILVHAARALPQIFGSIVALVAFCAATGLVLSRALGIDPLTAYLATSPGGMDSVAIIAAASQSVDMSFVMALQLARFIVVLVAGPPLVRLLARRMDK